MRRLGFLVVPLLSWLALVAATPLPLTPPPPDLTSLVPFVSAPLDKPPLKLPSLVLPPVPLEIPNIPAAAVVLPGGERPVAPMPSPRTLPCVGTWTGAVSEALECGRARFQRGDFEDAVKALDQAAVKADGGDPELLAEVRYWLGESYLRLGRIDQADAQFRLVGKDRSPTLPLFGRHASGWTAFMLGDPARARDAFASVLGVSHPVSIDAWARQGLGLAYYALGRYAEAERTLADLLARRPPPVLERDALFWHGDSLGRTGEPEKAAAELLRFTQGGPHPLLASGYARLGWWSRVAKRPVESVAAFRAYAAIPPSGVKIDATKPGPARERAAQEIADRDWVDAGLALALLETNELDRARTALRPLEARRSPLAVPVELRLAAEALKRRAFPVVEASLTEAMRGTLTPPVRAWILAVRGDAAKAEGKLDDARIQYDLARGVEEGTETHRYAVFALAQINLEMREATQALVDLAPLLAVKAEGPARLPVLLLQGEAAYRAGDYKTASAAFERVLAEAPEYPDRRGVHLALAWTALRERKTQEAGRRFAEFAELYPDDEQTPAALVLASEMALTSGNLQGGRELLDRVILRYPRIPRTDFARLNRAILMLRSGQAAAATPPLRDWVSRNPFPPLLGRAEVALGIAQIAASRPDDARKEFTVARREGEGALATLGLATVALGEGKLADAARDFQEARTDGTAPVAAAAEYGLAVTALRRGDVAAFKTGARTVLDASPRGSAAPRLLYALAGVSADAKEWPQALSAAKRVVSEFPDDERADDGLERVGAAAAKERNWPVAYEAYALLRQKYPTSPFVDDSRLAFAEALLETGRHAEGAKALEQYLAIAPAAARTPRLRFMLARARDTAGDHAGAADAYAAAAEAVPPSQWDKETYFRYVRLLMQERRYDDVRRLLEPFVRTAPTDLAVEASFTLGEALAAQGDRAAAIEYFMSAAYVAPDSMAGRRALIAAGRTFAASRQPEAAATVYRKLLAQSGVPAELVTAARQGLAALGR